MTGRDLHSKQRRRWLTAATLCLLLIIGAGAVSLLRTRTVQILSIQTNSMKPVLHAGDAVIVKKVAPRSLRTGDVITYRDPLHPAITITHRIIAVDPAEEKISTKGDNSSVPDTPFDTSLIIGRVSYGLVKMGYALDFLRSPAGLVAGTYAPAAIILWLELRRLSAFYARPTYRLRL